jgi:outer membrane protein TolC
MDRERVPMPFRVLFITFFSLVMFIKGISHCCAETLTYRDAIRDALKNSARIRVKVEDINISDSVYRQNFAGLHPVISANSRFERHENLDRRSNQGFDTVSGEIVGGDPSAWRSSLYLSGQYFFSHLYKKRFEATYYERLRDMKAYECDIEVKKLLREVTDVFSAAAEGKIKLRYTSEILSLLHQILHLKKQAFSQGQVSYEEVLKTEAEAAAAEKERAVISKEFRENLERLYSYTGKAYVNDMEIEGFVSDGKKEIADLHKLIENTPEYKARVKELEANKFKAKAADNNFLPDISMYGRYDYYGSNLSGIDNAMRDIRETGYSAGILITLPLFDGGVQKWERKRNQYEIRKQEATIKAAAEEKGRDIKTLSAGYTELSKALKHYRKLVDQYDKMLTIAMKAYGLGERSVMDLKEMEKESLSAKRDLKVTEQTMAVYEMRLLLEADYKNFVTEHYGDRTCKY